MTDRVSAEQVVVDLRPSGGPSLLNAVTSGGQLHISGDQEERDVSNFLEAEDMADIVAVSRLQWGYNPQMFKCPYCKAEDYSANHLEHTPFVWAGVTFLCMVGCWFGCCLVPFCVDGLKNVRHTCPNCSHTVGYHRPCSCLTFGTHRACCCGEDEYVSFIENLSSTLPPQTPTIQRHRTGGSGNHSDGGASSAEVGPSAVTM